MKVEIGQLSGRPRRVRVSGVARGQIRDARDARDAATAAIESCAKRAVRACNLIGALRTETVRFPLGCSLISPAAVFNERYVMAESCPALANDGGPGESRMWRRGGAFIVHLEYRPIARGPRSREKEKRRRFFLVRPHRRLVLPLLLLARSSENGRRATDERTIHHGRPRHRVARRPTNRVRLVNRAVYNCALSAKKARGPNK